MLASFPEIKAQQPATCWSSNTCSSTWTNQSFEGGQAAGNMGSSAHHVEMWWRDCNGTIEMYIDWDNTWIIPEEFFVNDSYNEKDFEGAREYLEFYAFMWLLNRLRETGLYSVPVCGQGTFKMFRVYTARCGVWLRCSYEFDCDPVIHQDGKNPPQYTCPQPWNYNGNKVVDVWHWEPCGEVCCIKEFELCKQYNVELGGHILQISNMTRKVAPGEECTEEGDFFRWGTDPPEPIPCRDGCGGTGN